MKKLLAALLMTSSLFAGTLENRSTGETIEFVFDRTQRTIDVLSASNNVSNSLIEFDNITKQRSNIRLLAGTNVLGRWIRNCGWHGDDGCVTIAIIGLPVYSSLVPTKLHMT